MDTNYAPDTTPQSNVSPGAEESVTEKLSRSAHDAIDRAAQKATQAETAIKQSAHQTEAQARAAAENAEKKGRALMQDMQDYAREHPLESLGIAFASGLVLSRLLSR